MKCQSKASNNNSCNHPWDLLDGVPSWFSSQFQVFAGGMGTLMGTNTYYKIIYLCGYYDNHKKDHLVRRNILIMRFKSGQWASQVQIMKDHYFPFIL